MHVMPDRKVHGCDSGRSLHRLRGRDICQHHRLPHLLELRCRQVLYGRFGRLLELRRGNVQFRRRSRVLHGLWIQHVCCCWRFGLQHLRGRVCPESVLERMRCVLCRAIFSVGLLLLHELFGGNLRCHERERLLQFMRGREVRVRFWFYGMRAVCSGLFPTRDRSNFLQSVLGRYCRFDYRKRHLCQLRGRHVRSLCRSLCMPAMRYRDDRGGRIEFLFKLRRWNVCLIYWFALLLFV